MASAEARRADLRLIWVTPNVRHRSGQVTATRSSAQKIREASLTTVQVTPQLRDAIAKHYQGFNGSAVSRFKNRVNNNKNKNKMQSVLLVEDDKRISLALSLRLQSMGYSVDSAADAVYAMNAAVRCKPEVVLLDINLPGGDGFVVADRIRSSAALAGTPIVFITASQDPNLRLRAGQYNASRFIEKPFQASQLTDAIDQLCH